jgi:antirestriction protein ArdC
MFAVPGNPDYSTRLDVGVVNELGIPTDIPHHASYIATWIKPLKDDKREIFRAAADAQRIASMELGFHPDYAAQVQDELAAVPG